MATFIVKAIQTNYMEIEIEAVDEDEALEIYEQDTIEDDFIRTSSVWKLDNINEKESN